MHLASFVKNVDNGPILSVRQRKPWKFGHFLIHSGHSDNSHFDQKSGKNQVLSIHKPLLDVFLSNFSR